MPRITTSASPTTELYFQDFGDGPPVILIHGWPLSHRMWESQISALYEGGYRVIAYDRRGFGESGRPTGGFDYDTFALDLHDLITHLDLKRVALVGFSMGGGEVARYVGRFGTERIAKAALLGAVTPYLLKGDDNPHGVDQAVVEGLIASSKQDRVGLLEQFFPNCYNSDAWAAGAHADLIPFSKWIAWGASPLAMQKCILAFGTTDFREDLAKFDMPTLIVHGDADRIVPLELSARQSHAMIAGSRLEVLEGAPHGFVATHAETLNALLIDFLAD